MRINRGSLPSVPDPDAVALQPDNRIRKRSCKLCRSENLGEFSAEVNIHFPGYEGLEKPTVWVFSRMMVCLDCGYADLTVAESELRALERGLANEIGERDEPELTEQL